MNERAIPTRVRAVIALVALAVIVLSIGGTAIAFWRATGAGAGTATSGSTVAVTLTPGTVGADLVPGGTAEVSLSATSSNSAVVRIVSLSLDSSQGSGGFTVTGDSPAGGCAAASFRFTTQSAGWDLPANGAVAISLPTAVSMESTAPNACQGATVTVYVKAGT